MSDLQNTVLEKIKDSLPSDIEKQVIAGLIRDSENLADLKTHHQHMVKQVAEISEKVSACELEADRLKVELSDSRKAGEELAAENRELIRKSERAELDKTLAINDLLTAQNNRTMDILDNQTRFFTQTTKRSVVVNDGDHVSGYHDSNGNPQYVRSPDRIEPITDTVTMNDNPDTDYT